MADGGLSEWSLFIDKMYGFVPGSRTRKYCVYIRSTWLFSFDSISATVPGITLQKYVYVCVVYGSSVRTYGLALESAHTSYPAERNKARCAF